MGDATLKTSASMRSFSKIPGEKLLEISKITDDMMQLVFRSDRQAALNALVHQVHDILEAEYCALFLIPEEDPTELYLAAQYTDQKGYDFQPIRRKVQSTPRGGLTGHLADRGELVILRGADVIKDPYRTGEPPVHLNSGECFSLLAIPLKDRKGRVRGLIKVENKKNAQGTPTANDVFGEVDEWIAWLLATNLSLVLQNMRTTEILLGLLQSAYTAEDLNTILNDVVRRGVEMFYADRGDLVLWNEVARDLVVVASAGEYTLPIGRSAPRPSITWALWTKNIVHPFVSGDVVRSENYHSVDQRTKSEMAVLLEFEGRQIGVLNIESFRPNNFDQQDVELLQLLAQRATVALKTVEEKTYFRGVVDQLGPSLSQKAILTRILSRVKDNYGFDGGIIYVADETNRRLRCEAYISAESLDIKDLSNFGYNFSEVALATKVFHEKKGYFRPTPATDPIVNPKGLQAFRIHSPLVGVPLIFDDQAVGVLVVWSSNSKTAPHERHIRSLGPVAQLAAMNIALSEIERQRSVILQAVQNNLLRMQTELSAEKNLRFILHDVLRAGFDRAIAFRYEEGSRTFTVLTSVGMESREEEHYLNFANRSSYLKYALADPGDLKARKCPDVPAPGEASLGLSAAFSVFSPLVVAGKAYGCILADTSRIHKQIPLASLDYLTLLGALAAHAIANEGTVEQLQRAEQQKEDFLRRVNHILGSATSGVKMLIDNWRSSVVTEEKAIRNYLPLMVAETERFLGLARNIADFVALRSDVKLHPERSDIVVLIQAVLNRVSTRAREQKVAFHTLFPSECFCLLDSTRTTNAIEALLDNALKFSPEGGTIHIEVQHKDLLATVAIRDEGTGVPEGEVKSIFESFYRGRNARDRHIEGSGLGLAIVQQTMNLHEGEVHVRNHPEGGAEFSLVFPRQQSFKQRFLRAFDREIL